MNTQELLERINDLLKKGYKVSEAEKELGFSDGQARKKLSKWGYKFDRKLNKYIAKNETVTDSNGVLQQKLPQIEQNPVVTHSSGVMPRQQEKAELRQNLLFTGEQVDILHKIINEYKVRQQIQAVSEDGKGKTINRNVRVYEKQFEAFASWCKTNNVTQADALYKAIDYLMNAEKL